MKRTLNYTKREKISRGDISIRLFNAEDGVQAFEAEVRLARYAFPRGAKVVLEAYYRGALMRFPLGVISSTKDRNIYRCQEALTELHDPQVNFRVKVVDEQQAFGLLVGLADRLHVLNETSASVTRVGLLPVQFTDLGEQIWKLEISDDGSQPTLLINNTLQMERMPIAEMLRTDPFFLALVYPQVLRQILNHALASGTDDEESWETDWLRFAEQIADRRRPAESDDADLSQWVEDAVEAFCRANTIRARLEQYYQNDQD
jgi:hypothetical protein